MSKNVLIAKTVLATSASWRGRIGLTYQQDLRNSIAKEHLEKLATEPIDSVPPDIVAKLGNYSENEITRESGTAARLVGFKLFPATLASFIKAVIDRIEVSRAEWQSAFRNDGGAK
jgi:hypothetical protein